MKKLKIVFVARLTRYNFGMPCGSVSSEFDHYPSEEELLELLENCNKDSEFKDFKTTISVDKKFQVIDSKPS